MTDILDGELVMMATFKLQEAAKSIEMLAKEAQGPGVRKLLTALAAAVNEQAEKLRIAGGKLKGQPRTMPTTQPRKRATTGVRARGKLTLAARR